MNKFLVLLVMVLGVIAASQRIQINDQKDRIDWQNSFIALLGKQAKIAVKLQSRADWYVINRGKVSSDPNGKGEIIGLEDQLLAQSDRTNAISSRMPRPISLVFGRRITFSPNSNVGNAYTIEGGLLTYELR